MAEEAHEYLMKQAPTKLMIGCLLLKTHVAFQHLNVSHCCNHCRFTSLVLTVMTKPDPHMNNRQIWLWKPSALTQQLWSNHSAHVLNPNQSGHHKNNLGLSRFAGDWCHLLVGGKRYSLIRVLISLFPHRIRQSRSEEKHLALIPLILRYTEHKLNYLTSCTICLNKITNMDIKPNEKRSKPKPTASSPRAVLMLSLTLNPSWLSRERERERSFIYRNHCWLLLCESVTSCFFVADKALVEFALFYCPRTNSHWGMYVSLYFSVISQDTELNERR